MKKLQCLKLVKMDRKSYELCIMMLLLVYSTVIKLLWTQGQTWNTDINVEHYSLPGRKKVPRDSKNGQRIISMPYKDYTHIKTNPDPF